MSEQEAEYKVIDKRNVPVEMPMPAQEIQGSPAAMMNIALNKGMDLDKLEKVMELQGRWEANEARKAYMKAMAAFKANPPEIEKDQHVRFKTQKGVTEYNHATLANVTNKISASLAEHGLSAAWKTDQSEKGITVACVITHQAGHSESTSLTAGPDTTGGKNAIQAVASTVSYLERYTILALTGLATKDLDDDGQSTEIEYISEDQKANIESLITETDSDKAKFLKFMKIESLDVMPAKAYKTAIASLEAKKKQAERQPGEDG